MKRILTGDLSGTTTQTKF